MAVKNFTVIGSTEGRPIYRKVSLWVTGAMTLGEIDAKGFSDAIDQLLTRLGADQIGVLVFSDHGHKAGLRLANDVIDAFNFSGFTSLRRLVGKFAPGRGVTVFDNCNAGQHQEPMKLLSKLWNVPVFACTGKVMAPGIDLTGETVKASPDGTFESVRTNIPISLVGTSF
jgi:hypothetical protein